MDQRKRVLVVDDSEDIRDVFDILLRAAGYDVETASSGHEAFESARARRPDAIILDVVMPGMDGLELLLKLRSDLAPPIPPTILCSGFGLTEDEALRRGAICFLRKPTEKADLLEAVAGAVRGHAVQPESVRRQRDHSSAAREHRRAEAGELVARIEANTGGTLERLRALAQPKMATLASYVGIARGALALVHDDRLEVLAATDEARLEPGFDLGAALPETLEVLETGSSLLLPDASAHPFSSVSRALGGIRFFAGAPLRIGTVPVGVVCLFDPAVHRVESDELIALELFGRRGSDSLLRLAEGAGDRLPRRGAFVGRRGIVAREMFEELLDAELRILDRRGGSMEVAVLDLPSSDALETELASAPSSQRLVATLLSPSRVALFKRALDDSALRVVAALLGRLRANSALEAVGVVELPGGGVRGFSGCELVHVAAVALDRAVERGDGTRRVIIAEEHAAS